MALGGVLAFLPGVVSPPSEGCRALQRRPPMLSPLATQFPFGSQRDLRSLPGVSTPSSIPLPPGTQFPSRSHRDRSKVAGRFNARNPAQHSLPVAERRTKPDLATHPTKGTPSCGSAASRTAARRVAPGPFACFASSAVSPPGIGRVGRWNMDGQGEGRRAATHRKPARGPGAGSPWLPSSGRSATSGIRNLATRHARGAGVSS